MGAGNKLDPSKFRVADISETSVCPLAKVMRKELKRWGNYFQCTHSLFYGAACEFAEGRANGGKHCFCPSAAGLLLASEVVRHFLNSE